MVKTGGGIAVLIIFDFTFLLGKYIPARKSFSILKAGTFRLIGRSSNTPNKVLTKNSGCVISCQTPDW
jgi:hypothetical protein